MALDDPAYFFLPEMNICYLFIESIMNGDVFYMVKMICQME